MNQVFCIACGASLEGDSTFCTECGEKVVSISPPATSSSATLISGTIASELARPARSDETIELTKPDTAVVERRFCVQCGRALAPGLAKCTGCGTPITQVPPAAVPSAWPGRDSPVGDTLPVAQPSPAPLPPVQEEERRRWPLLVAAVLAVALGVGGGTWWVLNGSQSSDTSGSAAEPEAPAGSGSGDDELEEDSTDTTLQSTESTIAASSQDCDSEAETVLASVGAWASGLDLVAIGSGAAPPAFAPQVAPGCDLDEVLGAAVPLSSERAAAASGAERAGLLAFAVAPSDPVSAITSAAAAYPARPRFAPARTDLVLPTWVVVLESLEIGEFSESQTEDRASPYERDFAGVTVIRSDDYVSLRSGYWAIIGTGFDSFNEGLDACEDAGLGSNECYPRLLQDLDDQSTIAGGCGYFGRYSVSTATDVQLHPRVSDAEERGRLTSGNDVWAAGPVYSANGGNWIPVLGDFEQDNKMAWAPAGTVTLDPACAGTPAIPLADTCDSVTSDAVLALSQPTPAVGALDVIVARAGRLGCDASTVNAAVGSGLLSASAGDPATALRNAVWAAIPVLQP